MRGGMDRGGGVPTISHPKPPVPLVWLDTWVFIRMALAHEGIVDGPERDRLNHLFDVLLKLRDRRGVICPETGHDLEIEAGRRLVKETRRVMSQVSLGVQTHFTHARNMQVFRAMKAYAEGGPNIEVRWQDVFLEDPIKELEDQGPLVRVDIDTTPEELADVRRANEEIARRLEDLRQLCLKERQTFAHRVDVELGGVVEATLLSAAEVEPLLAAGHFPSFDTYLRYVDVVADPRRVLSDYLHEARGTAGSTDDLVTFYKSPYYRELPAARIIAELYAIKLTGAERIKPSDPADMNQIAALLPFAHTMILDASMADKVRRLRLDQRFDVRVVSRVSDLIAVLEAL